MQTSGRNAGADTSRRWQAGVSGGVIGLLLGALAPLTSAVVTGSDPRLVATAAGLALLGAFAGEAAGALRDEHTRIPAVVTLLVAGSGVAAGPVGAAPLGLLAGGLLMLVLRQEPAP